MGTHQFQKELSGHQTRVACRDPEAGVAEEGCGAGGWAHVLPRPQLYLRELLRLTHPRFYQHLATLGEDGLQMLFCHRWLLLCFKREFPEAEALRIWEACWAHYQVRAAPLLLTPQSPTAAPRRCS